MSSIGRWRDAFERAAKERDEAKNEVARLRAIIRGGEHWPDCAEATRQAGERIKNRPTVVAVSLHVEGHVPIDFCGETNDGGYTRSVMTSMLRTLLEPHGFRQHPGRVEPDLIDALVEIDEQKRAADEAEKRSKP